jgi:hypothetical protein
MKQTIEGWTIAIKVDEMFKEHTYFMGIRMKYGDNKYVTLEAYPTDISVLKNLFETKEEAMDFWKNGMWDLCIHKKMISVLPVKIKVDIDVSCLGLDWNGM